MAKANNNQPATDAVEQRGDADAKVVGENVNEQQAAPASALPAAVDAAPVQPSASVDEFHGQGGLYELRDGRRVLIERTSGDA